MTSLLNVSINCSPIFDGSNFSLRKCKIKSFIQSIDFDFWDIITDGLFVSNWRRYDEDIIIKLKSEYSQDEYERFKKNSKVLCILHCALDDEIFNHVCSCKTAKNL